MNMNKNLHSKTVLTEFARDFEQDSSETVITKIVNKIYEACNNVNADIGASNSSTTLPNKNQQATTTSIEEDEITPTSICETSSSDSFETNKSELSEASEVKVYQVDASQGRTSLNVIKRISNLITMKNKNLNDYRNTELQKLWMPDDKSRECYDCAAKFTTFRRKHHCRLCGCIFCSKCCNQIIPGKIINCTGDLRVCTYCSKVVLSYIKSPDINAELKSDLQALEEDLSNKFVGTSNASSTQGSPAETSPHRKVSVGYQEERLVSNSNILSNADRKTILQQSSTLKSLYEDMENSLPNQNKGSDLVYFLISNQKSSNKQQAFGVLNAMIEAGFIIPLLSYDNPNTETSGNNNDYFQVDFDENLIYNLLKIEEIKIKSDENDGSPSDESLIEVMRQPSILDISNERDLHNSILSTTGSKALLEAYCEHEELLLNQMLQSENLDKSWSKILIPHCARIAHTIKPEFYKSLDSMDVRNFVNIKKISGGSRNDTTIIGGVVLSKNVAHKDMKTVIENARVLLLQCAIAYQRVEGKFVTIESLILQEKEYLRNVTSRILSLAPDVVIVHKNISGIAQDLLRQNGITVILDVKISVFERLARSMQCDILTSIDSNFIKPKMGICKRFYTKSFTDSSGANKTLMFFEIPYNQRSCSLLLRGGSEEELTRVKKVSSFLLFARYNWRLELSYLLDVFAQPPSPKSSIFDSIDQQSPITEQSQAITKQPQLQAKEDKKEKSACIENVHDFSDPLRASNFENSSNEPVEFEVQDTFDNKFRTSLASTILSISPYVNFPLPFLETEGGKKCELRRYFQKELFYSKQWSENVDLKVSDKIELSNEIETKNNLNPPHNFLTMKITVPADHKDFQTALADYRRDGGIYPKVTKMKIIKKKETPIHRQKSNENALKDALDINNHQRLPVLFCSFYQNDNKDLPASFCAQPLLLDMHFYGLNDISLGLFLERYCFRSSYICPSCKLPMMNHVRRYAHTLGVVQVKLDQDVNRSDSNNIFLFSKCTICSAMTQKVVISSDAWCFSFAKFLELKFHGSLYTRRSSFDNLDQQQESECSHSLHHDYIQYFSNNGVIVSFMYSPITTWEIKLPLLHLPLQPPRLVDTKTFMEKIKVFSVRGYEVYAKIHEKLANLSTEEESPMLASLKKILNRDQLIFKHRVEVVYTLLTSGEVYSTEINDAIYLLHKELADSIELWDPRLSEVATQLKNLTKIDSMSQSINVDLINEENDSDTNELELDLDGGGAANRSSCDDAQLEKKEKIDKKTIKKLLSAILTSSSLDNPTLPTPFTLNEHYNLSTGQFPILVHDQDLSSIIAYTLMSYDYKKSIENVTNIAEQMPTLKSSTDQPSTFESNEKESGSGEKNKLKTSNSHIELHFQDSSTQFTCKSYFAKEFDELRVKCLRVTSKASDDTSQSIVNDEIRKAFARSLSSSIKWEARGGKSGSKFSKTSDDRFILKEMSKQDVGEFEKFAPHYFEYVNNCIQQKIPTLLAKIFGVFKIIIKKKEFACEKSVLVIENLFCNLKISHKYDLKGSERNRLVLVDPTTIPTGETVLLDENLIKCKLINK